MGDVASWLVSAPCGHAVLGSTPSSGVFFNFVLILKQFGIPK